MIFTFICFTAVYSQEIPAAKELDDAIDNAKNSKYQQAIPVLKKYAGMKGLDDLKTLEINIYLNWCYLATKKEALEVDKVNTLTDAYIAKYGISKTDSLKRTDEIALLFIAGTINSNVGNNEKMVFYQTYIYKFYKENHLNWDPSYSEALIILAKRYYNLKDYKSAIEIGKEAWKVNLKLFGENNKTALNILDILAASSENIGETGNAIEYLQRRALIGKEILGETNPDYLFRINYLAEDYIFLGQYQKALDILLKAVELGKNSLGEKNTDYLTILNNLAAVYSKLGDYQKSFAILLGLVELSKEVLGEKNAIYLRRLSDLSKAYERFGDYQKAMEINIRVVDLRRDVLGDKHEDYITSLANLAKSYSENGDYLKAFEIRQKVVDLRKEVFGEKDSVYIVSLANLAVSYSMLGQDHKALELKLKVDELGKVVLGEKNSIYLANLSNLALGYRNIGNYKKALEISLKVKELEKEVFGEKNPDYLTNLSNISMIYMDLGDYQKALDISLNVWEIRKEVLGEMHPDYLQSMSFLERLYYGMGDFETSYNACRFNVKWTKEKLGENHPYYLNRLNNLSLTEFQLMKNDSALNHFREMLMKTKKMVIGNISMMTETQRVQYWEKIQNYFYPFPMFLEKTLNTHPEGASDAYNFSLFTKGLLLNTTIDFDKLIAEKGTPESIAKFEELKLLKLEIQRLTEKPIAERYLNVDSLENIAQQKETELVKISKEYGDYTGNMKINWKDIQEKLQENDVAIEFVEYPTLTDTVKYAALVLRKGWQYPKMISLFRKDQIEEFIKQDKDKIYSNKYVGQQIKKLIWEPLEAVISPGERVYFSPAGIIHQLAIENLPVNDSLTLGDLYEMHRLSSTKELAFQLPADKNTMAVLYGGLKYDLDSVKMLAESKKYEFEKSSSYLAMRGYQSDTTVRSGWKFLNGTKPEVDQISQLMQEKHYQITEYTGESGNEESFKSLSGKKEGIIHIATHGFFLPVEESKKNLFMMQRMGDQQQERATVDPMLRSGLIMAGGNKAWLGEKIPENIEDGVLTAKEISRMDLRGTDLVVLSACETGLGDVSSEGVFGLQRSFKQAGVQTLVMSLWEVSDKATSYMMTEFYSGLLSGKEKREAFLEAKQKCKEKFPEPQYWAAFIMLD
jgi:tetratricopeptide (TPR) repeat protein